MNGTHRVDTDDRGKPSEQATSKWPMVIGVISLAYAIGGLLLAIGFPAFTIWTQMELREARLGVSWPPILWVQPIVVPLAMFILGIWMLVGAIMLLRRRRGGVWLLQVWAVLRIVLLVAATAWSIVTIPAQVEFVQKLHAAQARKEWLQQTPLTPTEAELRTQCLIMAGIQSVAFGLYPAFLLVFLTLPQIRREAWRD